MKNNSKGFVSSGVLALIAALVVVGFLGWYLLGESQKVNDEYDAADQANSSLLKQDDVAPVDGAEDTRSDSDTSSDPEFNNDSGETSVDVDGTAGDDSSEE